MVRNQGFNLGILEHLHWRSQSHVSSSTTARLLWCEEVQACQVEKPYRKQKTSSLFSHQLRTSLVSKGSILDIHPKWSFQITLGAAATFLQLNKGYERNQPTVRDINLLGATKIWGLLVT